MWAVTFFQFCGMRFYERQHLVFFERLHLRFFARLFSNFLKRNEHGQTMGVICCLLYLLLIERILEFETRDEVVTNDSGNNKQSPGHVTEAHVTLCDNTSSHQDRGRQLVTFANYCVSIKIHIDFV